jgi:hypothetical protein
LALLAEIKTSCLITSAAAAICQQGSKLVGTGAVGQAFQGVSVALSADGSTAIVGGRVVMVEGRDYHDPELRLSASVAPCDASQYLPVFNA